MDFSRTDLRVSREKLIRLQTDRLVSDVVRVCILYGSRRGATRAVAQAIERALREKGYNPRAVEVKQKPDVADCDLVIVGAPVYYERPLPEVLRFIEEQGGLAGKKVAVFILSMAQKFGKHGREYAERRYLRLIMEPIKGDVISSRVFEGWLFRKNETTIKEAQTWAEEVVKLVGGEPDGPCGPRG